LCVLASKRKGVKGRVSKCRQERDKDWREVKMQSIGRKELTLARRKKQLLLKDR
jgi:hypothetical protein